MFGPHSMACFQRHTACRGHQHNVGSISDVYYIAGMSRDRDENYGSLAICIVSLEGLRIRIITKGKN